MESVEADWQAAVSACGGLGVISSAQIGYDEPEFATDQVLADEKAIRKHIALAKQISGDKPGRYKYHGGIEALQKIMSNGS